MPRLAWRLLLLAALIGWAASQPYAADGGFDRPRPLATGQDRPLIALALDAGRPTLVWVVDGALQVLELHGDGGATTWAATVDVRSLVAAGGPSAALVAVWGRRDLSTGRYQFASSASGVLLEAGQLLNLVPVATPGSVHVFTHRGSAGGTVIERLAANGAAVELYRTDLQVAGLSADAADGVVHLTWLEGFTEVTAFGSVADWRARAARLDPDGSLRGPVDLGAAEGPNQRSVTAAGADVVRAWSGPDGVVRRWRVAAAEPLRDDPADVEALIAGRPIGATVPLTGAGAAFDPGSVFVADGDRIWRVVDGDAPPTAIAWSPVVIRDAAVVRDASGRHDVVWNGTEVGGLGAVYASHDRQPMVRGWRDEVAAHFGWRPWTLAQEAVGQLAGSALAAVLLTAALLPLLWLMAAFLARGGAPRRARWFGALSGAAMPLFGAGVARALGVPGEAVATLVGGWWTIAFASASAVLIGASAWRRRDLEAVAAFVAAAVTAAAWAIAWIGFASFQGWLAVGWW